MKPNSKILRQFDLKGKAVLLPGGEGRTYRVGNAVLKHINQDSKQYSNWIANLFANIKEKGFRISRPLYTNDGKFITPEGWSAWTFLEGNHIYNNHIPESINAIISFHESIKDIPKPGFLDEDNSPYAKADKYSWGGKYRLQLKIRLEI